MGRVACGFAFAGGRWWGGAFHGMWVARKQRAAHLIDYAFWKIVADRALQMFFCRFCCIKCIVTPALGCI